MSIEKQKSKEYCEKNIPDMCGMHLTVSTAFEAGWDEAVRYLSSIPWDEAMEYICGYITEVKAPHDWIRTEDEEPRIGEVVYTYPFELILRWNGKYWEEEGEDFSCDKNEVIAWTRIPDKDSGLWNPASIKPRYKDENVILLLAGNPILGLGSTVGFVNEITHWMECPSFDED